MVRIVERRGGIYCCKNTLFYWNLQNLHVYIAKQKANYYFCINQIHEKRIMKKIKLLYINFKNELRNGEIELLRGAVLSKLNDAPVLFHNHVGDNFRYAYPLIQYKRIHKKASILCVEAGVEVIGSLFAAADFSFRLGERIVQMEIESVKAKQMIMQVWKTKFTYRINRWLPLNEENYAIYCQMESLIERYGFLQKKLIGNILSMAKGLDVYFEEQVVCEIIEISTPYMFFYKGVRMMAFNATFKTNVSLPEYAGLGKGVSLGNGILLKKTDKKD